eukprot:TRINITY_DN37927_c0_g1_i1.p1 TRINITY_DN37927_c0_g1~~TRINITY_DN37927_c0_g1_i1.p1  ORF type:complete len:456 (-),score=60.10 TRINITY_DN37927_c0_g1_i1:26-1393(-)
MALSSTRWWILCIFSLLYQLQGCTYNFYGPMFDEIKDLYGWKLSDLDWVANVANVALVLCVPLSATIVTHFGLRKPTLVCAILMFVCTALRCMPLAESQRWSFGVAVVSMACNGAAASWMSFAGPLLSSAWFPIAERNLATAIITMSCYLGNSEGFVLGPLVVGQGATAAAGLRMLCQSQAALSLVILIAIMAHFPERPSIAPSLTAASPEAASGRGMMGESLTSTDVACVNVAAAVSPEIMRATWCRVALVASITGVPTGIFAGWMPVLAPNLEELGIKEGTAAAMGCVMTILGCVGMIAFGILVDRVPGRMKTMLLICLSISSLCFFDFVLVTRYSISVFNRTAMLLLDVSVGSFFVNAVLSVGVELAAETAYPHVPAALPPALVSMLNNGTQIGFLVVSAFIPSAGDSSSGSTAWMNWLLVATCVVSIPPLVLFRAKYPRLALDGFCSERNS